jgi:hypothetical protein
MRAEIRSAAADSEGFGWRTEVAPFPVVEESQD